MKILPYITLALLIASNVVSFAAISEIVVEDARFQVKSDETGNNVSLDGNVVLPMDKAEFIDEYLAGKNWALLKICKGRGFGHDFSRLAILRIGSSTVEAKSIKVYLEGKANIPLNISKLIAVGADGKNALVEVGIQSSVKPPFDIRYVLRKCRLEDGQIVDVNVDFTPIL